MSDVPKHLQRWDVDVIVTRINSQRRSGSSDPCERRRGEEYAEIEHLQRVGEQSDVVLRKREIQRAGHGEDYGVSLLDIVQ